MANAGKGFLGLLDMIDGGGMGQSGSKFEGGPLSGLLNALGIRPHGYMDRLDAVRPQARPAAMARPQVRPSLPMTGMDEALVAPQYGMPPEQGPFFQDPRMAQRNAMSPLERFGGQPPNSSPISAPSYPSTGMDEGLAGVGMAPRGGMIGMDPGRVQEFANWMVNNYGTQAAQLSQSQIDDKYKQWLNARTGYRF